MTGTAAQPGHTPAETAQVGGLGAMTLAGVLALLTLWDFYLGPFARGFRPFDFAAMGVLVSLLAVEALQRPLRRLRFSFSAPFALLGILFLVTLGLGAGALADPTVNIKPAVGLAIGLILFTVCSGIIVGRRWLERVVGVLIVIHAFALILQAVVYYTSGTVLNYHAFLGDEPRVLGRLFRPSGLFLEPAHYGILMVMLLSLKLRLRPVPDLAVWVGSASVLMTLSIYGTAAVAVLLLVNLWRSRVVWAVVAASVALVAVHPRWVEEATAAVYLVERVSDLRADESTQQRYSGLAMLREPSVVSPSLLFGRGISNDYERLGRNGIAFIVNGLGVLGAGLFLALYARLAAPGRRWQTLIVVLLAMAAAPRWTVWLWWAWLGLYVNRFPQGVHAPTEA